mgnify:CR=1 FL=1
MELLDDPLQDRVCQKTKPPPKYPLSCESLFDDLHTPNPELLKSHFINEGRLSKPATLQLVSRAKDLFMLENNLLSVSDPVTIVGDIHGQFYDLLRVFELGGSFKETKYLFLGDYVDRGSFSFEVLMLLYAFKIKHPQEIFLLRGNHESRQMTSYFNFRSEVLDKQDIEVYDLVMESFDAMPLACVVNGKFFAVHGGISPDLKNIEDLQNIPRTFEPPDKGLICDLLWSDPVGNELGNSNHVFKKNSTRGCSYVYGKTATVSFLESNNMLSVIRAHEVQADGFKMHRWKGKSHFPVVVTIFSAPNYCDIYNNKAAVIKFVKGAFNVHQFKHSPHPYVLPNFQDLFSLSIPFIIEKSMEVIRSILSVEPTEVSGSEKAKKYLEELQNTLTENKKERVKNKLRAISRVTKMLKTLKEDNELVLALKGICPDNKIPKGLLAQGREGILGAYNSYQQALEWDAINEKRPD